MRTSCLTVCVALVVATAGQVRAGVIAFVSDGTTDTSIASVLTGAGHTVSSFTNQYVSATRATTALLGDLSGFDAVYWSATGTGLGSLNNDAAMLANLSSYVIGGGKVFVTGYDSISSPTDLSLLTFLGGSLNQDTGSSPGVISSLVTSLTTGLEDIRGLTPAVGGNQVFDRDSIGGLAGDTIGISSSESSVGYYQWTLRTLGAGEIAYVSNGNPSSGGETSLWADSNSAYNAAVLNFAYNASVVAVPEPTSLCLWSLGIVAISFARRRRS